MRQYALPAAVAFAAVLAIAVAAGSHRSYPPGSPTPQAMAETVVSKNVMQAASGAAPRDAAASALRRGHSAAAPQIARTGKIDLLVTDASRAVGVLTEIARRSGGDVFSLQLASESDSSPASAQMQLRIPASAFDAAMGAVARTGKVRQQSETASDLTGDIGDSAAQLRNLRRTEDDMRKIMDRSGSVEQILDVENQLSQVREQIETLESSLATMREQVIYSTIDVSLAAETSNSPVEPTAASQVANAVRAASHAFGQSVVAIITGIVWLVVFVPYFALIASIAWIAARRLRRERPSAIRAAP